MIGIYARDTITWKQVTLDEYGEASETTSTLRGRVVWGTRKVTKWDGNETLSSGHVLMKSKPNVSRDTLTIDGTEYVLVRVEEMKAFTKVSHYKVYLK